MAYLRYLYNKVEIDVSEFVQYLVGKRTEKFIENATSYLKSLLEDEGFAVEQDGNLLYLKEGDVENKMSDFKEVLYIFSAIIKDKSSWGLFYK